MFGVVDPDERDVVDLVRDVLQTGDRGLVLAGQVGVLGIADVATHDLVDRRCRVEHLVERLAGQRRAQHAAGAVTARLGGLQADGGQPLPDLGDVLDLDPVVLHVLRSEMSAVSRAKSVEIWPSVRSAAADSALPSQRTRIMKYLASRMSAFSSPVQVPS